MRSLTDAICSLLQEAGLMLGTCHFFHLGAIQMLTAGNQLSFFGTCLLNEKWEIWTCFVWGDFSAFVLKKTSFQQKPDFTGVEKRVKHWNRQKSAFKRDEAHKSSFSELIQSYLYPRRISKLKILLHSNSPLLNPKQSSNTKNSAIPPLSLPLVGQIWGLIGWSDPWRYQCCGSGGVGSYLEPASS